MPKWSVEVENSFPRRLLIKGLLMSHMENYPFRGVCPSKNVIFHCRFNISEGILGYLLVDFSERSATIHLLTVC